MDGTCSQGSIVFTIFHNFPQCTERENGDAIIPGFTTICKNLDAITDYGSGAKRSFQVCWWNKSLPVFLAEYIQFRLGVFSSTREKKILSSFVAYTVQSKNRILRSNLIANL